MEVILWIIFFLSAFLYRWVGKVCISQPIYNRPMLFWNPVRAKVIAYTPLIGFLLVVILGFVYTDKGWWYLGAVGVVWFFFSEIPYNLRK
jgi:hypothetical protein